MRNLSLNLPDALAEFVDEQVAARGLAAPDDYLAELIRQHQQVLLSEAQRALDAAAPPGALVGPAYFNALRQRVRDLKPASGAAAGAAPGAGSAEPGCSTDDTPG